MRRFLYALGCVTMVALIAGVAGFGLLAYKGSELGAESRTFVDGAVPAIVPHWNKEEVLDRATPEVRANANPEQLRAMFEALSRLGRLVQYEGAKGQAMSAFVAGGENTVSGTYVARAKFEGGSATFRIGLLKRDGHWMIHNFHVDPAGNGSPSDRGA
jgi:hypothetical protein